MNIPNWPEAREKTPMDGLTFSEIKEKLNNGYRNSNIDKRIKDILSSVDNKNESKSSLTELRMIIDSVRNIPIGEERIRCMNSIVRTLGEKENLSILLDILGNADYSENPDDRYIVERAKNAKMHSVYGWCGNTLLLESTSNTLEATQSCDPMIGNLLGNDTSTWNLTIHIWQPNTKAIGFDCLKSQNIIAEPPHSHPFDFASCVVTGKLKQSIYEEQDGNESPKGHYRDIELVQVDGVWPPHNVNRPKLLYSKENQVVICEGDSYYMPCNMVHDVEIDPTSALTTPAITLFLSSEYLVMPHAFICQSMADYHNKNTDLKVHAKPLSSKRWHDKIKAISSYLKGEKETLNLNDIVEYPGDYAFFHK
ncbi:hypothetical protein VIBNISFn27_870049 [Vibrio nigripulchritudo SFn27]|uniref:hypothetical protein n=1 Tax=Vibrio nigripulchritudo TaxID=28173 RepID=UPI0003B23349|nr:hypothetical protein [Vibrio nigripulchritudo]CCN85665.1 hypothetical protein VIBNIBLFn1_960049 [Vibrio nigripulchritudo BLFn1]CCN91077.1 hypothetical protein VIBNISFn27_870049 [Vibrio nigripulchritudo SFn27]CCN93549.1 hypothetical protein VIBNIENn2_240021 [Vibrio nigripulchritudo ENn2]CCO40084.1 hypothetical protein VIBNISFn135_220050 [Vibrio nigripulchritudo SFn135]CCO54156.1 hypothetical protein VIBNIWn13_640049 [Vibrio nigripulchritudo Wn13]